MQILMATTEESFPWTIKHCKTHIARLEYFMKLLEQVFIERELVKWYEDPAWRGFRDELTFWQLRMATVQAQAKQRRKKRGASSSSSD
jgi:tRNA(His) 5'-end guanylyltransferase